jgi:3D (Asp-Asp-Asp) domain-containing protein
MCESRYIRSINPELLALPRSTTIGGYRDGNGVLIADSKRMPIDHRRLAGDVGTLYIRAATGERIAFDPFEPQPLPHCQQRTVPAWRRGVRAVTVLVLGGLYIWVIWLLVVAALSLIGVRSYADDGCSSASPLVGHWVEVTATAYSPLDQFTRDDEGNPDRLTANQTSSIAHPYGIAVPRVRGSDGIWRPLWPYGTRVYVPAGHGYLDQSGPADRIFIADDTGGLITGNTARTGDVHIDLRYRSVSSAERFGSKRIWIYVLDDIDRRRGGH